MNAAIAVSGLPASGKSSLGQQIARLLSFEFFDKDHFLERLFSTQAVVDAGDRTHLSRHADIAFEAAVRGAPSAVAASWWRHPLSASPSGTLPWWLGMPGTLELHCACEPRIAVERFLARRRHPGHGDRHRTEEDLLELFEGQAALGPLSAHAIQVCTSAPLAAEQLASIAEQIAARLRLHT